MCSKLYRRMLSTFLIAIFLFQFAKAEEQTQLFINLYSKNRQDFDISKQTELDDLLNAANEIWYRLYHSSFQQNSIQTSDFKYFGSLINSSIGPVIEITNIKTGTIFYHQINEHIMPLEVNGIKMLPKSLDLFEQESANTINELVNLEKIYQEAIKVEGKKPVTENNIMEMMAKWDRDSTNTLTEVHQMYNAMVEQFKARRAEHPELKYHEFIKKYFNNKTSSIADNFPWGKGEINSIDDSDVFVRIVHNKTELSFIIKAADVDFDSKHGQEYIASQHIKAGFDRMDGEQGRDVIIIEVPKLDTLTFEHFINPEKFDYDFRAPNNTLQHWKEYFKATYKRPTMTTFWFGQFSGGLQAIAGSIVADIQHHVQPNAHIEGYAAPIISYVMGATIATYIEFYRNILNFGSPTSRLIKTSAISYLYIFLLQFLANKNGFQGALEQINPITLAGILWWGKQILNVTVSTKNKNHVYDIVNARELTRAEKKSVTVNFFGRKKEINGITRAAVENQVTYIWPFSLTTMDRLDVKVESFHDLPMGKSLNFLFMPIFEYTKVFYYSILGKRFPLNAKMQELTKKANANWKIKFAPIFNRELRSLLIEKMRAKINFNYYEYNRVSKILYDKYHEDYPSVFAFKEKKKNEIKISEDFQIPDRKLIYNKKYQSEEDLKPGALSICSEKIKAFLTVKIF